MFRCTTLAHVRQLVSQLNVDSTTTLALESAGGLHKLTGTCYGDDVNSGWLDRVDLLFWVNHGGKIA